MLPLSPGTFICLKLQYSNIMHCFPLRTLQSGARDSATVTYNTSLGVIFGVKKYAERLLEVVKRKDIQVNYKHKLIEVNVPSKEAVFEVLEEDRTVTFKVSQLALPPLNMC